MHSFGYLKFFSWPASYTVDHKEILMHNTWGSSYCKLPLDTQRPVVTIKLRKEECTTCVCKKPVIMFLIYIVQLFYKVIFCCFNFCTCYINYFLKTRTLPWGGNKNFSNTRLKDHARDYEGKRPIDQFRTSSKEQLLPSAS